jgi:hypothetical protein
MSVSGDGHGPVQLPVCYAWDADQGVPAEPVATFPAVRGESSELHVRDADNSGVGQGRIPWLYRNGRPEVASRCASFDFCRLDSQGQIMTVHSFFRSHQNDMENI